MRARLVRTTPLPSPYKIYRTSRLAELFDVDASTIWRWRKRGVLPKFKRIGGIEGLTEVQLADFLAQQDADNVR